MRAYHGTHAALAGVIGREGLRDPNGPRPRMVAGWPVAPAGVCLSPDRRVAEAYALARTIRAIEQELEPVGLLVTVDVPTWTVVPDPAPPDDHPAWIALAGAPPRFVTAIERLDWDADVLEAVLDALAAPVSEVALSARTGVE